LLVGSIASFVSAWIVVAVFIRFIQKHTLGVFGWYRIALGLVVLYFAGG
jgi:undecaprenyl-diphosphatase